MNIDASTALLQRYIAACESRHVDRIVACFAQDALVSDPLCAEIRGRDAIASYFHKLYDGLASLKLFTSPLYCKGDEVACYWTGQGTDVAGQRFEYQGIDVFQLTRQLVIARMCAYWDPRTFPGLLESAQ